MPTKFYTAVTLALLLLVSGCATLNTNPLLVDMAVRQAVLRYIDAGDSEADKHKRAAAVVAVVQKADSFLEGEPQADVSTLLLVVDHAINWDALSPADRMLLSDVMTLVKHALQEKQSEGILDGAALVGLRALFETAATTAALL